MQVEMFLWYGGRCVEGCAAHVAHMKVAKAVPLSIHMGRVAPLGSDKASGTWKKSRSVELCELCFKESQLNRAENGEWLRGCWLMCDHHHHLISFWLKSLGLPGAKGPEVLRNRAPVGARGSPEPGW